MTSTPTTNADVRLPQLGQAVARLLDAIAASADYQRDGSITYQSTSRGRWKAGQHTCGSGAIDTAASNDLITVEATGPTVKTLTLTEAGRRHVRARQTRSLIVLLEGEVTTLAAIAQDTDKYRCGPNFTFGATLIGWVEKTNKSSRLLALLTLEDEGTACDAWVTPSGYAKIRDLLAVGARLRVIGRGARRLGDGRLVLHVAALRLVAEDEA
ncbi:hypothetical protein [Nonomuraea sp. NPDC049141]|uniref:hypothetical protein n=1 Tax=Nonomuraea sp. NPDC049141 TaxID=3155500 RepID=UPI0033E696CD